MQSSKDTETVTTKERNTTELQQCNSSADICCLKKEKDSRDKGCMYEQPTPQPLPYHCPDQNGYYGFGTDGKDDDYKYY